MVVRQKSGSPARIFFGRFAMGGSRRGGFETRPYSSSYLNRYWRYMLALSSTSASVTWVRPLEATLSSMRLRIKRRIRNGLRFILRSASGSQVISLVSGHAYSPLSLQRDYIPTLLAPSAAVWSSAL